MEEKEKLPKDMPPYRWFIGLLGDGTYRFITPYGLRKAEQYIGKHGGAVYTHAGYLVFAANKRWYDWLMLPYLKEHGNKPVHLQPPQINVPEIECTFSQDALKWLEENEELLKEAGGKYYENLPRNRG